MTEPTQNLPQNFVSIAFQGTQQAPSYDYIDYKRVNMGAGIVLEGGRKTPLLEKFTLDTAARVTLGTQRERRYDTSYLTTEGDSCYPDWPAITCPKATTTINEKTAYGLSLDLRAGLSWSGNRFSLGSGVYAGKQYAFSTIDSRTTSYDIKVVSYNDSLVPQFTPTSTTTDRSNDAFSKWHAGVYFRGDLQLNHSVGLYAQLSYNGITLDDNIPVALELGIAHSF